MKPIPEELEPELARLAFRRLLGTALVGSIGVVGTTCLIANHDHDPIVWKIGLLTGLICLLRLSVILAFALRRKPELSPAAARRWTASYATATLLYCSAFAVLTLYVFLALDGKTQFIVTMGAFSLCAGISARIGLRPWITQLCAGIILGALAVSVLRPGDLFGRIAFFCICSFAFANWESVRSKFDIVVEQLRTRVILRTYAEQDSLTGLANRRRFEDRLAALCSGNGKFGILYMDLDKFKQVNDTFGHPVGDALLQQVANRLRTVVRQDRDLLARIGGDEFAILQSSIDDDSPQLLALRIREALTPVFLVEGHRLHITTSIGARLAEGSFNTPRTLLGRADAALYRVKQAGGGSFALAED